MAHDHVLSHPIFSSDKWPLDLYWSDRVKMQFSLFYGDSQVITDSRVGIVNRC